MRMTNLDRLFNARCWVVNEQSLKLFIEECDERISDIKFVKLRKEAIRRLELM